MKRKVITADGDITWAELPATEPMGERMDKKNEVKMDAVTVAVNQLADNGVRLPFETHTIGEETTNEEKIEAIIEAVNQLAKIGIRLPYEVRCEVVERLNFLEGFQYPMLMEMDTDSKQIAEAYLRRNQTRRSVILFKEREDEFAGSSTVLMPNATSKEEEIIELVDAMRKIVQFNKIKIDDLWPEPEKHTVEADLPTAREVFNSNLPF